MQCECRRRLNPKSKDAMSLSAFITNYGKSLHYKQVNWCVASSSLAVEQSICGNVLYANTTATVTIRDHDSFKWSYHSACASQMNKTDKISSHQKCHAFIIHYYKTTENKQKKIERAKEKRKNRDQNLHKIL